MLRMLKDGYRKKTVQDRVNYGIQLKNALEEFTEDFLPHMKEEEEVTASKLFYSSIFCADGRHHAKWPLY